MSYIYSLLPSLILGLATTLEIFVVTLLASIPLGIVIALGRLSNIKILSKLIQAYILVMRGTPLMLQLVFVFFGLPYIGIALDRNTAALVTFILNYTAYFAEIFRGGIGSIDIGQYEGATVLGLSKTRTIVRIVLPQVIKIILPSIANEVINLVKDTSLVYVVGLGELLRAGRVASNRDASIVPFIVVGGIYLLIIMILTEGFKRLEKRYSYYH